MSDSSNKREIRFALVVDPESKRVFVQDTAEALQQGAEGAAAAGESAKTSAYETVEVGKAIGQVWSAGMLLRLAGAGYLFKRLAQDAKEPSPALKEAKADLAELTGTIGTELQAAAGGFASGMKPVIEALADARGGVHGLILGAGLFIALGPRLRSVMMMAGIGGGPWMAALAGGLMLAGAAVTAYGERVAAAEAKQKPFKDEISDMAPDEVAKRLNSINAELARLNAELTELDNRRLGQAVTIDAKLIIPGKSSLQTVLENDIRALEIRKRMLDDVNRQNAELLMRAEGGKIITTVSELPREALQRLQAEVTIGKKTLAEAGEEMKGVKKQADGIVTALQAAGQTMLKAFTPEQTKAYKDAANDSERTAVQTKAIKDAQQDVLNIQIAQAENGKSQSEQRQKERSEATHRRELYAQIADALAMQGPIHELNSLQQERSLLIERGVRADAIEILEIDKKILDTEKTLTASRSAQAIVEGQLVVNAERLRKEEEQAQRTFATALTVGGAQLRGESELTTLRIRIGLLQQQAGLETASFEAILRRSDELSRLGSSEFGPPVLGQDQVKEQRGQLGDMLTLMVQYRQKMADSGRATWQPFADAAESATRNSSRALAQMFTKGEAGMKAFADSLNQTLEDLIAQLIENGVVALLASLFSIPLAAGGGIGGLIGGLFSQIQSLPNAGRTPWMPSVGGSNGGWAGTAGIEAKLDRLNSNIEMLAKTPFQAGELTIRGGDLRTVIVRQNAQAKSRSLG